MTTLKTNRLKLRPLKPEDAPAITRLISNWNIMQWLTSPPWPYALKDAEWFVGDAASNNTFAITQDGTFIGAVGGQNDLGYWLGEPYWGQGIMTEAATTALDHFFARGTKVITSGYIVGNGPSCAILTKLGFTDTHIQPTFAVPHGKEVPVQRMTLDRARWSEVRDGH